MSHNIAKRIVKDVKNQRGQAQIHVILLGDNNLRKNQNQPEDVLTKFKFILSKTNKIKKCKIIDGTLVPSISNMEENFNTFKKFDEDLAKLVDPKYEYEFLDLRKSFKTKKNEIKEKFFKNDGVNSNNEGADVHSTQIFNKIERLPKSFIE